MQMDERHEGAVLVVSPKEQALDAYAASSFREDVPIPPLKP